MRRTSFSDEARFRQWFPVESPSSVGGTSVRAFSPRASRFSHVARLTARNFLLSKAYRHGRAFRSSFRSRRGVARGARHPSRRFVRRRYVRPRRPQPPYSRQACPRRTADRVRSRSGSRACRGRDRRRAFSHRARTLFNDGRRACAPRRCAGRGGRSLSRHRRFLPSDRRRFARIFLPFRGAARHAHGYDDGRDGRGMAQYDR